MSKPYPIHERFHAFQGEGIHMGRSAFFIRTFGCPVHCPWCDSAGTWHKDWIPKEVDRLTSEFLRNEIDQENPEFIVITGGEPTIHDLRDLVEALQPDYQVHLETSGSFDEPNSPSLFNWVTLSPKWAKLPTKKWLLAADEIKIIVESEESIPAWLGKIEEIIDNPVVFNHFMDNKQIWLHPEWSQRANEQILKNISNTVKSLGGSFRAGYQLHKLYQVDGLDDRAKELTPLGGNPEKYGY